MAKNNVSRSPLWRLQSACLLPNLSLSRHVTPHFSRRVHVSPVIRPPFLSSDSTSNYSQTASGCFVIVQDERLKKKKWNLEHCEHCESWTWASFFFFRHTVFKPAWKWTKKYQTECECKCKKCAAIFGSIVILCFSCHSFIWFGTWRKYELFSTKIANKLIVNWWWWISLMIFFAVTGWLANTSSNPVHFETVIPVTVSLSVNVCPKHFDWFRHLHTHQMFRMNSLKHRPPD